MKGRQRMKIELKAMVGEHELPKDEAAAVLARAYAGHRASAILARLTGAEHLLDTPDAEWLHRILRAVEARLVEAVWTAACEPMTGFSPAGLSRHGQDYIQEFWDAYGNAREAGGKWEQPAMRQPIPSAKAIDAKWEPLMWLWPRSHGGCFDRREQAVLVHAAAATKRGEIDRNVAWARVLAAVPELTPFSVSTLRRRYEDGLRAIVADLLARGEG